MGFWKIWFIGLAITIFTSVLIHEKVKINRILIDMLVVVSIVIVGGIAEGWVIACGEDCGTTSDIIFEVLTSCLIWLVGAPILGIFKKKQFRIWEIISFILVYIVASVFWSRPFINYYSNIEDINETIVVNEQENKLLYFCNIPVQKVSGSILGDVSGSMLRVDGEISGSIFTVEELQYWYLNENGDIEYNSVSTNSSKIRLIEESEKPYVKVITYRKQTRTVNHNNNEETTLTESEWKEYIFYLPEAIMQYPLDN